MHNKALEQTVSFITFGFIIYFVAFMRHTQNEVNNISILRDTYILYQGCKSVVNNYALTVDTRINVAHFIGCKCRCLVR